MPKLLIDSNVYINFYQSSANPVEAFDQIVELGKDVIMTDQIHLEFKRNRQAVINRVLNEVKLLKSVKLFDCAVVARRPEFNELKRLKKEFKTNATKLEHYLAEIMSDPRADPVVLHFNNIVKSATYLECDQALVERAQTRKLRGIPPTSKDKYSLGDELIWETLLDSEIRDDLLIVTSDQSFIENHFLLCEDWLEATHGDCRLLATTNNLNDALEIMGRHRSDALETPVIFTCSCGGDVNQPAAGCVPHCKKCGQTYPFFLPLDMEGEASLEDWLSRPIDNSQNTSSDN